MLLNEYPFEERKRHQTTCDNLHPFVAFLFGSRHDHLSEHGAHKVGFSSSENSLLLVIVLAGDVIYQIGSFRAILLAFSLFWIHRPKYGILSQVFESTG